MAITPGMPSPRVKIGKFRPNQTKEVSLMPPFSSPRCAVGSMLVVGSLPAHFDGKKALRMGIVNDCVPRDQLMSTVMNVAGRIAMVPRHSVRCMKRMIMSGFLSFGLAAAMELCSAMSALGHTSHDPDRQAMFDAQERGGFKAFLEMRDGPFQPEPMGPKSK